MNKTINKNHTSIQLIEMKSKFRAPINEANVPKQYDRRTTVFNANAKKSDILIICLIQVEMFLSMVNGIINS